ncbi:hypothetical protein JHW43_007934 [Diplocarpon mali]|nr:hypothetical protein JHW43_007934 [Diplocarpon mali]
MALRLPTPPQPPTPIGLSSVTLPFTRFSHGAPLILNLLTHLLDELEDLQNALQALEYQGLGAEHPEVVFLRVTILDTAQALQGFILHVLLPSLIASDALETGLEEDVYQKDDDKGGEGEREVDEEMLKGLQV